MVRRLLSAALAVGLLAFAQGRLTINQLREFLRSSVQLKTSDMEVAKYLRTVKLAERLDDRTVEDLQGQGLGPKTVAALKSLSVTTTSLPQAKPEAPPPPPPPVKPPPSSEEQAKIIDETRENSLNYTNGLPDYICWQVTRWYINPYGHQDSWISNGRMVESLSYVNHHEEYKTITVNDQVSNVEATKLGHSLSRGEFGSLLREIFDRNTRTDFAWEKWSGLHNRWMYVFSFQVSRERSQYTVGYGNGTQSIVVGYHGTMYIDRDARMVVRINMFADTPPDFPVQKVALQLDYDYTKVGDQQFLLPLVAEMKGTVDGKWVSRNTIDFRHYEKFSADAQIKFDSMPADVAAPSDEKMKEQVPPK